MRHLPRFDVVLQILLVLVFVFVRFLVVLVGILIFVAVIIVNVVVELEMRHGDLVKKLSGHRLGRRFGVVLWRGRVG